MGVHRTCGGPNEIELTIRVLSGFFTAPLQAACVKHGAACGGILTSRDGHWEASLVAPS